MINQKTDVGTSQHETAVHSEPHIGGHGTNFEGVDASVKLVLGSLAAIALTLVITAIVTFPIQNLLKDTHPLGKLPSPLAPNRVIPTGPLLEVHPWDTLPQLREHERQVLSAQIADTNGQKRVPITEAMTQVLPELHVRSAAVSGLTTPGGQGRDFAGSVSSLPSMYQAPSAPKPLIEGEIQKNAK